MGSPIETCRLDLTLPRLQADFNAFGGANDESLETGFCYYFNEKDEDLLVSLEGKKIILYDFDSDTEITACEAIIESYNPALLIRPYCVSSRRARPIKDSWYWGSVPWPLN